MNNLIRATALLIASSALVGASLRADDWPQWRGPQRTGLSQETGLLKKWPEAGPKMLWHVKDAGAGFGAPAVVGDRIFLMANTGLDDENVKAMAVKDGQPIWSTRIGKVGNPAQQPNYPAARSTPTVDGEKLYALGSDGDLVCLETATGKPVWQKNLRTDFGGQPGIWAYSESPLVDGDTLLCTPGGNSATLVALNKTNGDLLWKCATPNGDQAAYASAIIIQSGGVKQYVQFLQKGLVGVDAKTGKLLWHYDRTAQSPANIPTPIASEDYVYSAAGLSGAGLVKLSTERGTFDVTQIYFTPKLPTAIGGAVLVGTSLYGTTRQMLVCADFKTGDIKWSDRSVAPASVCVADGQLYLHGEEGDVALVEATPAGYHENGRFTPSDSPARGQAKAWAYPAIADGKLYIRDAGSLWCYDVKVGDTTK